VRLPSSLTVLVLVAAAFGFVALWDAPVGIPGFWLFIAAIALLLMWNRFNTAAAAKRWLFLASDRPIVLKPPFTGRWRVASGGPNPAHNHHQATSDQYFAYDFVRSDGETWDQPILAPCDGMIAHVENRQEDAPPNERRRDRARPLGNYVSIQASRGYVILAHLRSGSVPVRVGDSIRAGDEIGHCGNSGNTRGTHLHVHAQDQPSQAVAAARGIPIAFVDRGGDEPMLLEFGDGLGAV
jgi:murein DD-endopeptidase MepM/ murein hydrolase activator NlpD